LLYLVAMERKMPSKSKSQHNLMEAAAHGAPWAEAKVKPNVAKEFAKADKGKKFKNGGMAKPMKTKPRGRG